jgi:hypothetical protein
MAGRASKDVRPVLPWGCAEGENAYSTRRRGERGGRRREDNGKEEGGG